MSPKEQEITLVVQSHHLTALELGERREQCLKHSSDGVSEPSGKIVQNEFGVMWCCSCMPLVRVRLSKKWDEK